MFVHDADMSCLRQGDILAGVPFPLLSSADLVILGRIAEGQGTSPAPTLSSLARVHRNDPNWLTAQVPVRMCRCAVVSQCCDLEPRHGKILIPAFAVARLIPIPARILEDPQRLASLRGNKDPRDRQDPGYVNFFHIPNHESLGGQERVVDYNQVASIPGSEFPVILEKKILQMEDRWRAKFKIKLATSLARLTSDELDAGLEDAWRMPQ